MIVIRSNGEMAGDTLLSPLTYTLVVRCTLWKPDHLDQKVRHVMWLVNRARLHLANAILAIYPWQLSPSV